MTRIPVLICLCLVSAFAQAPVTEKPATPRDVENAFMLVATHAAALFESADMLDARLHADGSTLHPATIALRLRIERTLDQAQAAIDNGDLKRAGEEIKVADELVSRLSRRIGGE